MISVVTITCRQKPGFQAAADSIAKAAPFAPCPFEWVVVDELLRPGAHARAAGLWAAVDRRFGYRHLAPARSPFREQGLPDPNRARNAGLGAAKGDYVVFLDDSMTVSPFWLRDVGVARERSWGFRSTVVYLDGPTVVEFQGGAWHRMAPAQCSGIFGAPFSSFALVGGFDEGYAGEMGYEDLDCVMRLHQSGIRFYGTRASAAFHFPHKRTEYVVPAVPQKNRARFQARFAKYQI